MRVIVTETRGIEEVPPVPFIGHLSFDSNDVYHTDLGKGPVVYYMHGLSHRYALSSRVTWVAIPVEWPYAEECTCQHGMRRRRCRPFET